MGFSEKLQKLRKKNFLTQENLAELLGVSRQAIAKWESAESYPEIEKLIIISDKFKVTLDSLLKDEDSCSPTKENEYEKFNEEEIIDFLCRAKKLTYASSGNKTQSSRPNSNDLEYIENEFKYIDSYLGSEKFIGEEGLWIKEKPYWSMNYAGRVVSENFSGSFLKEVLLNIPKDKPFRGPSFYEKGDYKYISMINGDFSWFQGKEEIYLKDKKIYECIFHGGKII